MPRISVFLLLMSVPAGTLPQISPPPSAYAPAPVARGQNAERFTGLHLLPHFGVDAAETGEEAVIAALMLQNQNLPVTTERPGEHHPAAAR